ncbi:B3 DNA binding domain [Dillenia turbinata]|uniref:B3 DNA binding domain n=1 Tax=Dillenia turbinata TaxID=194707 RepID=A0AAN8W7E7_9MAGN
MSPPGSSPSAGMLSCPISTFGLSKLCFSGRNEQFERLSSYMSKGEFTDFETGKPLRWPELFRKELTESDVSRLVVPKKQAMEYFPPVGGDDSLGQSDIDILILDGRFKLWKIRFAYRNQSSGAFKLTTGWPQLVQGNNMKPKDVLIFYGPLRRGKVYALHVTRCTEERSDSRVDACLERRFDACVGPCFNVNHGLQLGLQRNLSIRIRDSPGLQFGPRISHVFLSGRENVADPGLDHGRKRKSEASSGENDGAVKKFRLFGAVIYP